jgi:dTDP-4-dehydrorhamnose reductase
MRIILLGSQGMLGSSFPDSITKLSHADIDITDYPLMREVLRRYDPQFIINCVGITDLKYCEENKDASYKVNVLGSENLAAYCGAHGIKLIQFSAYASGSSNYYTQCKELIENRLPKIAKDVAIFRLPWLFSNNNDRKFQSMVISHLRSNISVPIYTNEIGSPTYTVDIAEYILNNIKNIKGIHNIANKGKVTRLQWIKMIAKILGYKDIKYHSINRIYAMPKDMVVRKGIILRAWDKALRSCLD